MFIGVTCVNVLSLALVDKLSTMNFLFALTDMHAVQAASKPYIAICLAFIL